MGGTCSQCLTDSDDSDPVDSHGTSGKYQVDGATGTGKNGAVCDNESRPVAVNKKQLSMYNSGSAAVSAERVRASVISVHIPSTDHTTSQPLHLPHTTHTHTIAQNHHISAQRRSNSTIDTIRPNGSGHIDNSRETVSMDGITQDGQPNTATNGHSTQTIINTDTNIASDNKSPTVTAACTTSDRPPDMMALMMAQTRDTAMTGTDKASTMKRAAMSRAADEILPFLYLGAYHNVWAEAGSQRDEKNKQLVKMGITQILTVAEECQVLWPLDFHYLKIPIFDLPSENIAKYFQTCIDFIDRARYEDGKVLVHCWVGVSRSASIVIAYLMARCDMRLAEAYEHVKSRRNIICPNKSFLKALEQLDADLWPDFVTGQYAA